MKIDWNVAPDWAIGHAIHATTMGVKEVWVGEDKYQQFDHSRPFPYGGTVGADSFHNPRRNQFAFETLRPAPWTGEGLPPVGTVCEVKGCMSHYLQWNKVTVFAVRGKTVMFDMEDGRWGQTDSHEFRPIRTPEQIAAEERWEAVQEMVSTMRVMAGLAAFPDEKKAEALYDAGYRKHV